jgi:F-type H+-transporting ATPase subunit alpha
LGGGVRLALAQYRELAAFAQFASDLDETTRKQLERGQRVMESMKQKQYSPLSVAQMSVVLFAADKGYLDDVKLNMVVTFEAALLKFVQSEHAELMSEINEKGDYNDNIEQRLKAAVEGFKQSPAWKIADN